MRSCNPFNPFPGSARVFCLFYMKGRNRLHSEHIFFKDTVILYVSTFAGLLCTSVIPGVRHSLKFKMAFTFPLKTGTLESKRRINFSKDVTLFQK